MSGLAQTAPGAAQDGFLLGPRELAQAILRLRDEPALSLPALGEPLRRRLAAEAGRIGYRDARPVIGEGDKAVYQDFEVSLDFPRFPPESPFTRLAADFEALTADALASLDPPAAEERPRYNDLIVQRYPAQSRGISPHRDHLRYRILVALFVLSGDGRFAVCADRSGRDAWSLHSPPGSLLLMRAPGLWGLNERPFHFLDGIRVGRVSLGVRYDCRAPDD